MTTTQTRDAIYYVVKDDNLSEIAELFRTTVAKLKQLNNLHGDIIQPGQRLIISHSGDGTVPFPGKRWFHRNPDNPVVLAMARRLVQEGCGTYHSPEPDTKWSPADKASYKKFQEKHGFSGPDADGFPGPKTWKMLKVPTPPA
ncbi:peptidoglycan-binding protein [Streptomyces sp. NPDC005263]|uniref:LysM peptidoglycan-binding domain-containing protein n=1 Tax=Streptomyces sp. NPDC005263 TaxID=3364711 RepID=UPI0036C5BBC7